jgi:hypothetical protein
VLGLIYIVPGSFRVNSTLKNGEFKPHPLQISSDLGYYGQKAQNFSSIGQMVPKIQAFVFFQILAKKGMAAKT